MSEAIAGVPEAPAPLPVRDASVVILYRQRAGQIEVFWLKRDKRLRFAGGFYAFAGGKLDDGDACVPVEGSNGHDAQLIAAAARELFEETGILMARGAALTQETRNDLRRQLLDEKLGFGALLAANALRVHAEDFKPAGRWVTPTAVPVTRFDARFYLVEAPGDQVADVWPGELSYGAWVKPADALVEWENGKALLHPPNVYAMQVMKGFRDAGAAVSALAAPPDMVEFISTRLEFQRGVRMVPLRTATLPPATHTNCYVLGTKQLLVVDPGSADDAEIDQLIAVLSAMKAQGCSVEAIVLTHHHGDHVGGVERLVEKLGLPVWAHEKTADRLETPVAKKLEEDMVLELEGPLPMRWRVLYTPGHARGHVTLVDQRSKAAIVGDMVAGVGTIIIDPPEGDMTEYLAQLRRLRSIAGTLYPAHGPPIPNGSDKLDEYLTHRAWRETRVFDALKTFSEPVAVSDLVTRAYDDVAAFVWPIAERNTAAILQKLVREGRVIESPDGKTFHAA